MAHNDADFELAAFGQAYVDRVTAWKRGERDEYQQSCSRWNGTQGTPESHQRGGRPRNQQKRAHDAVRNAIRRGELIRQACEICGDVAHAHHDDYAKPLVVRWLCPSHHRRWHVENTPDFDTNPWCLVEYINSLNAWHDGIRTPQQQAVSQKNGAKGTKESHTRGGRSRVYATNAARQKAYRIRSQQVFPKKGIS